MTGGRVVRQANFSSGMGQSGWPRVSPVGEMLGVLLEGLDRPAIALGDADLLEDRIGLDVDTHRAPEVLVVQLRGSAHVEEAVRASVDVPEPLLGEPVADPGHPVHVGPAVREAEARHHVHQEGHAVARVLHHALDPRVVRMRARVLDVVDVVAEPGEPQHVVDRLPADTREGMPAGEVQDDEALAHFTWASRTSSGGA
jgi:hypothetical protein